MMNSTEFLLSMMGTWPDQLSDRFPLPAEGRCALVRGQIQAAAKLIQPEATPVPKPGPRKGFEGGATKTGGGAS